MRHRPRRRVPLRGRKRIRNRLREKSKRRAVPRKRESLPIQRVEQSFILFFGHIERELHRSERRLQISRPHHFFVRIPHFSVGFFGTEFCQKPLHDHSGRGMQEELFHGRISVHNKLSLIRRTDKDFRFQSNIPRRASDLNFKFPFRTSPIPGFFVIVSKRTFIQRKGDRFTFSRGEFYLFKAL